MNNCEKCGELYAPWAESTLCPWCEATEYQPDMSIWLDAIPEETDETDDLWEVINKSDELLRQSLQEMVKLLPFAIMSTHQINAAQLIRDIQQHLGD